MGSVLHEVAAGVFVATSRREHTTSTLVVSGSAVTLVDPAWDPDELAALADAVDERRWTVAAGISTHAHHDHLLWHPRYGPAPRFASPRTRELADEHRDELLTALGPQWPPELGALVGRLTPLPGGGVRPVLPHGEPVEFVVHDGHAPGHTAVWFPARRVLLAGDMLSDLELPLPLWPDDLPAYLAGLDQLAPYVARADVLVPGHGSPTTSPAARLDADRGYLDALLAGGDPDDARRANPGMADVHEQLRRLTADHRSRRR